MIGILSGVYDLYGFLSRTVEIRLGDNHRRPHFSSEVSVDAVTDTLWENVGYYHADL